MNVSYGTSNNVYGRFYNNNQSNSYYTKSLLERSGNSHISSFKSIGQGNRSKFFSDDKDTNIQSYFGGIKHSVEKKIPTSIYRNGLSSSYKSPVSYPASIYPNWSKSKTSNEYEDKIKKPVSYFENKPTKKYSAAAVDGNTINNLSSGTIARNKCGMQNLGNTCFMNTCLQNLIHTESFIQSIIEQKDSIGLGFNTPLTNQFYNLCKMVNSNSQYSSAISPSEFKKAFSMKHMEFQGYSQHDTQEFCRLLLEDMSQELNTVKKKSPYVQLETDGKSKEECDKEFDDLFRKKENSIVIDNFYGQLISIFTCAKPCRHQTFSFEKFLDIPLIIPSNESSTSVKELMQEYFKDIQIQFEQKCSICRKKTIQTRQLKISRLPENIILSIQRINGRIRRKNTIDVRFEEEIDLKNFVDSDCFKEKSTKYSLYGIGNHSGTIDFGHYYAYIKIKDDWYEFNDSMVSKRGTISNSSSTVYVLFYKRKK